MKTMKEETGYREEQGLRLAWKSDPGPRRETNEDALYTEPVAGSLRESHGRLLLVADGLGGHASGEVASGLARDRIPRIFYESPPGENPLRRAFQEVHREIRQLAGSELQYYGMGTTCTALLLHGKRLSLAHVGDSRAYLLRDGVLELLTRDHTLTEKLIAEGTLLPEEAEGHRGRHILVSSLGSDSPLRADFEQEPRPLQAGDRLLLCTDGLSSPVPRARIREMMLEGSLPELATDLVEEAKKRGGTDNITVLIADWD